MKKAFLFLVMLVTASANYADDYKSLVFQTSDGTTTAVDLSSLVLTISNGKLTATSSYGTESFTLSNLSKMYFSSSETTGIEGITADDADTPLTAYDVSGRKVGDYKNLDAAKSSLKQGVYVIKLSGKTFKIVVK